MNAVPLDASFLAVRPADGTAVTFSSPLNSPETIHISAFNVRTQTSGKTLAWLQATPIGPFYDEKLDSFFFYYNPNRNSKHLVKATVDPVSLKIVNTTQSLHYGSSDAGVGFNVNSWAFDIHNRTICGTSSDPTTQATNFACINVDQNAITHQIAVEEDTPICSYSSGTGIVCLSTTGLDQNGCISMSSGEGIIFVPNISGPGKRVVAQIAAPSTPVCPVNSAVLAFDNVFAVFSTASGSPGFWAVSLTNGTQSFVPVYNPDFSSNVESFLVF